LERIENMEKLANNTVYQPHGVEDQPLLWQALDAVGAWLQQRKTRQELMACSDRVLDDIGIAREDIPLVASGGQPVAAYQPSGWLAALRSRLDETLARRREEAELMAYSDQELDDVGIRRTDIPAIIKGALNPRHA
jgi:uncharacterized protein YjiS (DUF1127 family)